MDKKFKQQLGLIAFGVALFTALNNLNYISDFLHVCAELLTPVFAGLLMAFILSVPMRGIGKRLSRLMPKASERTINVLSLIFDYYIVAFSRYYRATMCHCDSSAHSLRKKYHFSY